MKRISIVAILALVLLSGCGIYGKYTPKDNVQDDLFGNVTANHLGDTLSLGDLKWQQLFTDPQLQSLINSALTNNISLQQARLSIDQAEASLKAARLAYWPSLTVQPQVGVPGVFTLLAAAEWQIDAFGSITTRKRQAKALAEQSRDLEQAVQTQLIANVASLYFNLVMLDQQVAIIDTTIIVWEKSVETIRAMMGAGLTNSAAVHQLEASLHGIRAQRIEILKAAKEAENALCLLLHEPAHAISRSTVTSLSLHREISIGIPVDLLKNRPDVRAAERNLEAAYYSVCEARSNFYPKITLNGLVGWSNDGGTSILNPAKLVYNGVAQLTQPLFAQGTLRANLKIRQAQCKSAELAFADALLRAGTEVNNALAFCQSDYSRFEILTRQTESLYKAFDATRELMNHGSTSYLEVLTAQESYLNAQLAWTANVNDMAQDIVKLYVALGGGRN